MNKQSLQYLIELQGIDYKIHKLEAEKQLKPRRLKERQDSIARQKQSLENIKNEVKKTKVATDKKNLSLKEKEERVNRLNVQLNTVRTNKEYSVLLAEINNIKAEIAVLEDEILGLFSKVENSQKSLEHTSEKIARAETEFNQVKQEVVKELQDIDKELTTRYGDRKALTEKIPSEMMATYEKLMAHKPDKIALASVEIDEAVCQGCFMDLTPQEINELLKGTKIVRCRSCSRILYLKPAK